MPTQESQNRPGENMRTAPRTFPMIRRLAGSALAASGAAPLAFVLSCLVTACAGLSWMVTEWEVKGKPSMLGAVSGAVAGLVAITPAAGYVGIPGAFVIGIGVGIVCFWGV